MVDTYLELIDHLNSTLNLNYASLFPVPAGQKAISKKLMWIDKYGGQPEAIRDREPHESLPIPLPAIFIEWVDQEWTTKTLGIQEGLTTIRFHIVQETAADFYFNAHQQKASSNQEQALNIARYLKQVHSKLQGFATSNMVNALSRVNQTFDTSHNNVHVDLIDYQCVICDDSANVQNGYETIILDDVVIVPDPSLEVIGKGFNESFRADK